MARLSQESWIVPGILVVGVTAAILAAYLPQNRRLKDVRSKIASQKLDLSENAAKAAVVPAMLRRMQEMKALYKDFDRALPQSRELGGFLREISDRMTEEGLSDPLIEPGNPTREELFHTLPIIMRFKASYLSLARFLHRIDTMDRVTRVQSLRIDRKSRKTVSGELDIELQMNIYFTSDAKS